MIEELRQRLQALQRPPGFETDPGVVPLGVPAIDDVLGGGLSRGTLHEIAAPGEAHVPSAAGFAAAVASLSVIPGRPPQPVRAEADEPGIHNPQCCGVWIPGPRASRVSRNDEERAGRGNKHVAWIAEDMALSESGALYGPGLLEFGLAPERLLTVAVGQRRDLLWTMEEALRCRTVSAVIGELRGGALDSVAVRRLSLAAAESGALALLLRAAPVDDVSTAATRWIIGAAPSQATSLGLGAPCFAAHLVRNRRGPAGSWIIEWSDSDARFILATHAQPVAAPALDRPHRQITYQVA